MNTKLTLSLDEDIVAKAKAFAKERHTSISKMLEDYLRVITGSAGEKEAYNPVDALVGIVNDPKVDYDTIRYEALKKKHNL